MAANITASLLPARNRSDFRAIASNRTTEALAFIVISFTFIVYSHHLGTELNHGLIASVKSLLWTLPQSQVFSGYGPVYNYFIAVQVLWRINFIALS